MQNYCDLHNHSVFSDGTDTPAALISIAEELGLAAIALCDHNTTAGLPEFLQAAKNSSVEAVPGVEFSADWRGTEVHILGLWIGEDQYDAVEEFLRYPLQCKEESNRALVASLNRAGYALNYEALKAQHIRGNFNRAHVAAALVELGAVSSVKEAFDTLLREKHGHFRRAFQNSAADTVRFIRSIGAVCVLAHPLLTLEEDALRQFLEETVPLGLQGMEVYYSTYNEETTALAASIAAEFHLLPSGGSDYHGQNKPYIRMGRGKECLHVPCKCLSMLKALSFSSKKAE